MYMRPHISCTECIGFLKQDGFCLLPKVSGANVHWENANHTFLTHKNPQTNTFSHDISPLSYAVQPGMESPREFQLMNQVHCHLPCTLHKAIVQAFLAMKTFAAGSLTYPCHMACISKSVPRDITSLSNYQGFMCIEQSIDGIALTCGFLVEKRRRSQYSNKTGLWRNALLVNPKRILVLVGAYMGNRAQSRVLAMTSPVSPMGAAT